MKCPICGKDTPTNFCLIEAGKEIERLGRLGMEFVDDIYEKDLEITRLKKIEAEYNQLQEELQKRFAPLTDEEMDEIIDMERDEDCG